jgi:putative N-acetylmannosamine-6-phosphate epimerase
LVVSLEACHRPPLDDPGFVGPFAQAIERGGAGAIMVDSLYAFRAVQPGIGIPVLAAIRDLHASTPLSMTPTVESACSLIDAGATLVVTSATRALRPDGNDLASIVEAVHTGGAVALGLVESAADLAPAFDAGLDALGTQPRQDASGPDLALLRWLVRRSAVPVYCGGPIWSPEQAAAAFDAGASFVVVGAAISDPAAITARFAAATPRHPAPR